jgi:hypothetical protein
VSIAKTVAGRGRCRPSGCRDERDRLEATRDAHARRFRAHTETDVDVDSTVDRARQAARRS